MDPNNAMDENQIEFSTIDNEDEITNESQEDLFSKLDELIEGRKLIDLHTHLMGMGNMEFWTKWIMAGYIPRKLQSVRQEVQKVVEEKSVRGFLKNHFFPKKGHSKLSFPDTVIKSIFQNLKEIEFDVVYDITSLQKGLGLPFDFTAEEKEVLKSGVNLEKVDLEALNTIMDDMELPECKLYNVLNFRNKDSILTKVIGISNSEILKVMDKKEWSSRFRNAFSILNDVGNHDERVHSIFRGRFDYFDRRFALKDPIYQQYPEVLGILLNNSMARYKKSGVNYVEFSMSARDLSNPFIVVHLQHSVWYSSLEKLGESSDDQSTLNNSVTELKRKRSNSSNQGNSTDAGELRDPSYVTKVVSTKDPIPDWRKYLHIYRFSTKPDHCMVYFLAAIPRKKIEKIDRNWDDLDDIVDEVYGEKLVHPPSRSESIVYSFWKDYVVGYDLVGDEYGVPFVPFVSNTFLQKVQDFAKDAKQNGSFGFRIHGGENLFIPRKLQDEDKEIINQSMKDFEDNLMMNNLEKYTLSGNNSSKRFALHIALLLNALSKLSKLQYPTRIGHGVAFGHEDLDCFDFLSKRDIPLELNLTSNQVLLYQGRYIEFVKRLLVENYSVLLSTDDDGIWSTPKCGTHHHHILVAAEYCKAIELGLITENLKNFMDCGFKHCFGLTNTKTENFKNFLASI
ncbi:hypothetical protein HDV04_001512 [Boothiomyces sp. JEL0838]|nr:hypothetical protein HDV04_001512 [Boothiomyces sp. JEL0838]